MLWVYFEIDTRRFIELIKLLIIELVIDYLKGKELCLGKGRERVKLI